MQAYLSYRRLDAFDLLGVDEDASPGAVEQQYLDFSRRFAPWALGGPELADMEEKGRDLFLAGARAYSELLDLELRNALLFRRQSRRDERGRRSPADLHAIKTDLLDPEVQVGLQADRRSGPACIGGVPVVADQRPLRRLASVVEGGLADELDLDLSLDALNRADQHMVGVVVGGRPGVGGDRVFVAARAHGQRVAHHDPAVRRLPRRLEHVRSRLVDDRGRVVDPEWREAEEPRLAVEQAAEDAWRIEARHAEPVDRPVGGDERTCMAVGEERVLRDRRERRRGGRALRLPLGCGLDDGHDVTQGSCQRPCPETSLSAALGPQLPGA